MRCARSSRVSRVELRCDAIGMRGGTSTNQRNQLPLSNASKGLKASWPVASPVRFSPKQRCQPKPPGVVCCVLFSPSWFGSRHSLKESKLQGLSHPSKCARRQGNPPKTRGWERIHPSPRPNPTTHHRQCTGHHQHPSRLVQPNPAQSPALGWVGEVGPTANSSSRSTLHPHSPPPSHSSAGAGRRERCGIAVV